MDCYTILKKELNAASLKEMDWSEEEDDYDDQDLPESLRTLRKEAKDLVAVRGVPRISVPTPLEFYRNFVAANKPVIITGAVDHWRALKLWSNSYLEEKLKGHKFTVDVTPGGHGDCIVDGKYFVKPEERLIEFGEFLQKLSSPSSVHYIQHQNGNFLSEFSMLAEDIDSDLSWVTSLLISSLFTFLNL